MHMGLLRVLGVVIAVLAVPAFVFAAGAHDGLNCVGCHGIHTAKGELIFAVEPNKKAMNARTKQPFSGTTALCLGCHETIEKGGMGIAPIEANHSHPFNVTPNAKVANVPDMLLREGKLECVGCHDPHPSNPNHKYLRVDTARGAKMGDFCGMCHSSKADPSSVKSMKIFNSMDERKSSASSAPASMPAASGKK